LLGGCYGVLGASQSVIRRLQGFFWLLGGCWCVFGGCQSVVWSFLGCLGLLMDCKSDLGCLEAAREFWVAAGVGRWLLRCFGLIRVARVFWADKSC